MPRLKPATLTTVLVLLVSACGGGGDNPTGGSGTTNFSDSDVEDVSYAARDTMITAIGSETGAFALRGSSPDSPISLLKDQLSSITSMKQAAKQVTTTETYGPEAGTCGGSISGNYSLTYDDVDVYPILYNYEMTYDQYCLGSGTYQWTYNGDANWEFYTEADGDGYVNYYYDLTYTSNYAGYGSGIYYANESCVTEGGVETCSTSYNASSASGIDYNLGDVEISGNNTYGYSLGGTITDSNGNTYEISFDGLTICADGNIGSGGGTIIANGSETISIEFVSCSEFVVTYQGNSQTYQQ